MNARKLLDKISDRMMSVFMFKYIRYGLMYTLPLVLIGSFATLLLNIPIKSVQEFLDSLFMGNWRNIVFSMYYGTFQIISMLTVLGISYSIIINDEKMNDSGISPIIPLIVVFGCYFTIVSDYDEGLILASAGTSGLFSAIMVSILATKAFIWFYDNRFFKQKMLTQDLDMIMYQTLRVLEPAFLVFTGAALLKFVYIASGVNAGFDKVYGFLVDYFVVHKNAMGYAFFAAFSNNFLWFFGIHGSNLLEGFNTDVYNALIAAEPLLVNGRNLNEIFSSAFFNIFVYMGGSGTSLCLIAAIFLRKKSTGTFKLTRYSLIPGIFNLNEMLVYGLPIVMNPYFFIPFVFVPIILTFTSCFAMVSGLVPIPSNPIRWTSPIFIGGYIATGNHIGGAILQVFNFILGTLIYYPFVKIYETHVLKQNKEAVKTLFSMINKSLKDESALLINRKDEAGFLARTLAKDIVNSIKTGENPLHLEYQPQVNTEGRVVGCEALLRWEHENYGRIIPPVVVSIAEESGNGALLGNWVIKEAIYQQKEFISQGITDVVMSINLDPEQLKNPELLSYISGILEDTKVPPSLIEFELTENTSIENSDRTYEALKGIKNMGCKIAIDDFGMGHSSLIYIRDYDFDVVKLDGKLVRDIVTDKTSQEIVTSVTTLCKSLNLLTVAEVVETELQRNKLCELGCNVFQGYLYSPSLKCFDFIDFVRKYNEFDVSNLSLADFLTTGSSGNFVIKK